MRGGTPEGYRELREFKLDLENEEDSDEEDFVSTLNAVNDLDQSVVIVLNPVYSAFSIQSYALQWAYFLNA